MNEVLKLLMIEDSEDDTELFLSHLRKGGFKVDHARVADEVSLRHALTTRKWDLIISDHKMPSFSAPEALRIVKETGIDVPFIIVSGAVGEETAVAAMRAGAHDYLMKGNLSRLIPVIHRELTEAAHRRDKLEAEARAREAVLHAYRDKTNFIRNMSHELRTPLNGVIGMTSVLMDANMPNDQRECVKLIRESGQALLSIVDDILDYTKIEAGTLVSEKQDFDLQDLLTQTTQTFRSIANQKRVQFAVTVDKDTPLGLKGDRAKLRRILSHLLGNALKFTERGEVRLKISQVKTSDGTALLRFTVIDTGIGISEAVRGRIFELFFQQDASSSRKHGGTGIGLSLCKALVEFMGGTMDFASKEQVGSTFWCVLPFQLADRTLVKNSAIEPKVLRVLVTEDNPLNQKVTVKMLERMGFQTAAASNGKEGMEIWEKGGCDVILMDCQMPIMDGYETTVAIRKAEASQSRKRVPIIALTSHIGADEKARCLAAGMDGFLTKPVDSDVLEKTIRNLVEVTSPIKRVA